jgi:hypothetical protein
MDPRLEKSTVDFISLLLHSRTQAHIFHFRTHSFAAHKALEEYYTGIVSLLDSYTEGYQGNYGLLSGYKSFNFSENPNLSVKYFERLIKQIEQTIVPDAYLKNIMDTIYELAYKTLYLLKNLK